MSISKYLGGPWVAAFLVSFSFFFPCQSTFATMTVTPLNGGSLAGSTVYYAVPFTLPTNSFFDSADPNFAFKAMDPTYSFINETSSIRQSPTQTQMFLLQIQIDKPTPTPSPGQVILLTLSMSQGGTTKQVPIAYTNGQDCSDSNCYKIGNLSNYDNGYPRYYGVPYTPNTIIGFYPLDICRDFNRQVPGSAAPGCSTLVPGSGPSPIPNVSVAQMVVSFSINNYPNDPNQPSTLGTAVDSGSLNLNLQADSSSLVCPSDPSNIYFPGDRSIIVNGSLFGLAAPGVNRAPPATLVVIFKDGFTPVDLTPSGYSSSPNIVKRVALSDSQTIDGFQNTTNGSDHLHNAAFAVRDAAGILSTSSASGCQLSGVQTSQVRGFLQASKCFLATAAFRSLETPPISLLRRFRSQVLLRSETGRTFVRWYNRWSPQAAEWLMENSGFRFPILLGLVPVEIFAWLALHPIGLWISLALGLTVLGWTLFLRLRAEVP